MKKRLLLAALIVFLVGLVFVAAQAVGSAQNTSGDLSTAFGWALVDMAGLGLWFVAFIIGVLGLVLKEDR